jgi:N-acetylmuramoyl-L-alanine amidase
VRVAAGRRGPRPGVGIKGVTMAALAVWALASVLVAGAVQPERFDTVVLDPGHGGDDHGAEGPRGLLEKDLTLDVARRLARELEARGLRVVLSRREDRFVGLAERTRVANEARADLFVSIHANGAEARAARGVETYFASLEASDEAAKRLAIAENEAFGGAAAPATTGSDPLAAILGDMIATEHLVDSQEFARLALEQLAAGDATHSRGVKQAPFVVLMGVEMPAALVEIGFITNVREEAVLTRAAERDRIAKGLAAAVAEYGRRYDARRGGEPAPSPAPAAAAAGGGSE